MNVLAEIAALEAGDNNFSLAWCAEGLQRRVRELAHEYRLFLQALRRRAWRDGHRYRWRHLACCTDRCAR